jgi:hypothetical protein
MPEEITISRDEYERLLDAERYLDALYAAGVDNWDGYSYALEIYNET